MNGKIAPMKYKTTLILRDKKHEVRAGSTLLDALKKLEILPESVICVRDGELITEDRDATSRSRPGAVLWKILTVT